MPIKSAQSSLILAPVMIHETSLHFPVVLLFLYIKFVAVFVPLRGYIFLRTPALINYTVVQKNAPTLADYNYDL